MFDFVWWAKHVLGASISIGGTTIRVYLGGYPDKAECKSDIVFEVNTGKVYSNYPEVQWLSANDPEEWRRTLLAGSTVMRPSDAYLSRATGTNAAARTVRRTVK